MYTQLQDTETAVVWSCFPFIRSGQNHLARHSERGKKTRRTKEEVRRQHQGMDWPGVRQVPEGSGEQGKMEKTGCKIICGAPTTLAVKGLMMMMMMKIQKRKSPESTQLDQLYSKLPRALVQSLQPAIVYSLCCCAALTCNSPMYRHIQFYHILPSDVQQQCQIYICLFFQWVSLH